MKETMRHTRESWLEAAIDVFRESFANAGYPLPDRVHVSVGFSYGARAESKKIMGTTYSKRLSADDIAHVFISPEVGDTFDVLETLLHELIHVADDCESGHRGRFISIAEKLGLTKPWTYTPSTPAVQAELMVLAEELGDYPHGVLNPRKARMETTTGGTTEVDVSLLPMSFTSGPGKQNTRRYNVKCPHCGYLVMVTKKWIAKGLPSCPEGYVMEMT